MRVMTQHGLTRVLQLVPDTSEFALLEDSNVMQLFRAQVNVPSIGISVIDDTPQVRNQPNLSESLNSLQKKFFNSINLTSFKLVWLESIKTNSSSLAPGAALRHPLWDQGGL